ncbi:MAG: hypothetical protein KAS32_04885 [Candidatus Peribacteraceae bacterium]|nr:hypothetical protein [Candidatus Peribacteraceae bacterium]
MNPQDINALLKVFERIAEALEKSNVKAGRLNDLINDVVVIMDSKILTQTNENSKSSK